MHAWIRLTLIFIASLSAVCTSAVAEDVTFGVMKPAANPPAEEQPTQVPPRAAFPTITLPGQELETEALLAEDAPAVAPDDAAVFEDEEAPDAVPEEVAVPVEAESTGGPKSQTDKIVDTFMQLDTDESKSVSVEEYLIMVQQRVEARFTAMDADGDGEVSEEEYRSFWKSRMAKWYRLKR